MNEELMKAIKKSPDYSTTFDDAVERIRTELSNRLNLPFMHDKDMNYSVSQRLIGYFNNLGYSLGVNNAQNADFALVVFISSKENIFTMLVMQKQVEILEGQSKVQHLWSKLASDKIPPLIQKHVANVSKILQELGYKLVIGEILEHLVPGYTTKMDNKPATLFEILFSEIY